MERGVYFFAFGKKIYPHSRESGNLPESLTVFRHRTSKTVRKTGRFPLSREWECFFAFGKKNILVFVGKCSHRRIAPSANAPIGK